MNAKRSTALRLAASAPALLTVLLASRSGHANPRPLPFTYIYETLPEGETEIEQYVDYVPTVATTSAGVKGFYGATQLQTEFEHGLTDRLELGLYVTFAPAAADFSNTPVMLEGNGIKQRLRYRLTDTDASPIDVGVYGEITENEREIELEGKVILQRRFGALRAVANAVVEREYYFNGNKEWELDPSAGLTYAGSPTFQPGIEYWMHAEYDDSLNTRLKPQHYIGPAALVQNGKFWWSAGVYLRLTDLDVDLYDNSINARRNGVYPTSRIWVRTVIGLEL